MPILSGACFALALILMGMVTEGYSVVTGILDSVFNVDFMGPIS